MEKYNADDLSESIEELSRQNGVSIHWVDTCDSTNVLADALATTGWRGIVLTDHQEKGRGRMQRLWSSERGKNILLSWVSDWHCSIAELPRLTLLLAAELAHEFDLWVKWPNDLMTQDGCKVGGILSSVHTLGFEEHTVVIGVGINVHQTNFPPDIKASSLQLLKAEAEILGSLEQSLSRKNVVQRIIQVFDRLNVGDTLDRWRERSITLGKTVDVAGRRGSVSGIREDGALIVDGIPITSGDVTLLEM